MTFSGYSLAGLVAGWVVVVGVVVGEVVGGAGRPGQV